ncbi:TPA: flagellar basal body L-ring protein FlgH, partial [Escherichia coli]
MSRLLIVVSMSSALALVGCVAPAPKPNDPYYAPVLPRTPLPAAQNNGAIYQAGFETNLYDDRKAHRVGDIITITLNERTQASKNATSKLSKDSSANIGLGSLFGGAVSMANPLTGNSMNLGAEYEASRDTSGSGQA